MSDDRPMNLSSIATLFNVSPRTVTRWKSEGYVPELTDRLTTPGHLKAWLRARQAGATVRRAAAATANVSRLDAQLAALR